MQSGQFMTSMLIQILDQMEFQNDLENHGIRKIQRQNGKNPLFDAHLVRLILKNRFTAVKLLMTPENGKSSWNKE